MLTRGVIIQMEPNAIYGPPVTCECIPHMICQPNTDPSAWGAVWSPSAHRARRSVKRSNGQLVDRDTGLVGAKHSILVVIPPHMQSGEAKHGPRCYKVIPKGKPRCSRGMSTRH